MQIALITLHTPTPANCRGASALPYHLLAFRPKDVHVEVWSFNLNGCTPEDIRYTESTLALTIHLVDKPQWFGLLAPAAVRLLLPRPMLSYIFYTAQAHLPIANQCVTTRRKVTSTISEIKNRTTYMTQLFHSWVYIQKMWHNSIRTLAQLFIVALLVIARNLT